MKRRNVFIGDAPLKINEEEIRGEFVEMEGERYYKISNADRMPDFFISIVAASDQWMFISSNGALCAGRKNSDGALFPYYSEDKIHDYKGISGSKTLLLVRRGEKLKLWEPFAGAAAGSYSIRRNLYKNSYSNKLIFEEINEDLELSFRYGWYNSERFGFVKQASLTNHGSGTLELEVLDGLQNILPSGVDTSLQLSSSNLLDAYKRQERVPGTSLVLYRLSSVPTDAAEPSEALKVNTVWSEGLKGATILLSGQQLDAFRSGFPLRQELDMKATRGAYFAYAPLELAAGTQQQWSIVAEVNQDAADLAGLRELLSSEQSARELVQQDIRLSSAELVSLLASADALQCTADELSTTRHVSNVLFNVMRGGVFADQYRIPTRDFLDFISNAHRPLVREAEKLLEGCNETVLYGVLLEKALQVSNPNLLRLCYEYMAITFSRRHGDPSRPWNKFSIENRKEDGSRNLDYQGNWRDIFQNWEALALSFPGYLESMISKFANASTADGYNPYRITRNGIDWEVPDPTDPWSNIGYWGDHQVIYLLKLLEISANHHPGQLHKLLTREQFSYANVPYRIKPYFELLGNPQDTILFDAALEKSIQEKVKSVGSDGKLVWNQDDKVLLVNLAEKLLVTMLTKLSNFIPGAGIWMNTQRPEWNDANNALVGYGVSMVTASYLRAFIAFCRELFGCCTLESIKLSEEVEVLFTRIREALSGQVDHPERMLGDRGMKSCMDLFGKAGSDYRQRIYKDGFSGKRREVQVSQILEFFDNALLALDHTIKSNRREDRLYHAYNLIRVEGEKLHLRRLYEMLEGQVAVLASGFLEAGEAVDLLDALKASKLFRKDQYSYILYPNRSLPSFLEKNNIPEAEVNRSALLKALLSNSNSQIVIRDVKGVCHFHAGFRNAGLLKKALDRLPQEYASLVEKERTLLLEIYEKLFDHQSFTGRSGTFYGYEGLGSIYWHMVSKLLLAVCETYYRAYEKGDNPEIHGRLAAHYYEIRAGIGLNKDPDVYGAFPTDPYSHTPFNRGAQQPGMTGQVKEDIIARWGELGIIVRQGTIRFHPILLRKEEFLPTTRTFVYQDVEGGRKTLVLEKDTLAFTYCQVPVIYHLSGEQRILLYFRDGRQVELRGSALNREQSAMIFNRSGEIIQVDVWLTPAL